jgi:hypothetical protein
VGAQGKNHYVGVSHRGYVFKRDSTEYVSVSLYLKMETEPVSQMLCFLIFRILGDGQSPETQVSKLKVLW